MNAQKCIPELGVRMVSFVIKVLDYRQVKTYFVLVFL